MKNNNDSSSSNNNQQLSYSKKYDFDVVSQTDISIVKPNDKLRVQFKIRNKGT